MEERKPYKKLIVWREAHIFVLEIYRITERFPKHEMYGLVSQLRRAAVSVATNLVEGNAKHSRKELLRFLEISLGSLTECEYLMELARDLKYYTIDEYDALESQRAKTAYLLMRFTGSIHP